MNFFIAEISEVYESLKQIGDVGICTLLNRRRVQKCVEETGTESSKILGQPPPRELATSVWIFSKNVGESGMKIFLLYNTAERLYLY